MRTCENCERRLDHPSHYRNCVPKKYWPAEMLAPKVYETPEGVVVTVAACPSCGYTANTAHGLKVHVGRAHKVTA